MSPGQRQETRIHRPRKRGASPSGASHRPPERQGKPPILRMRRLRPGQGTRLLYEPGQAWNAGNCKGSTLAGQGVWAGSSWCLRIPAINTMLTPR